MAAWSHRIDTLIWAALCFSFIGWLTALVGVTTSQRELHGQDDDNGRTFEFQWWLLIYQLCALLIAGVVVKRQCYGARLPVAFLLAICVPLMMLQADLSNPRRAGPTLWRSADGGATPADGGQAWPSGQAMAPTGFQQFEATVAPTAQSIANTAVQTASTVSSQMPAIPLEVLTNVVKGISQGLATASQSNSQGSATNAQLIAAMANAPSSGYAFYSTAPAPAVPAPAGLATAPSVGPSPRSISAYLGGGHRRLLAELYPLVQDRAVAAVPPDAPYRSDVMFAGFLILAACDTVLVMLFAIAHPGGSLATMPGSTGTAIPAVTNPALGPPTDATPSADGNGRPGDGASWPATTSGMVLPELRVWGPGARSPKRTRARVGSNAPFQRHALVRKWKAGLHDGC